MSISTTNVILDFIQQVFAHNLNILLLQLVLNVLGVDVRLLLGHLLPVLHLGLGPVQLAVWRTWPASAGNVIETSILKFGYNTPCKTLFFFMSLSYLRISSS